MTNEFTVIGEHRDDQTHLLVLGADGHYYGYSPAREELSPVVPNEDWIVNVSVKDELGDVVPLDSAGLEVI